MPRNRLTLAILAFVLVAAACGGGDHGAPASSGDDTLPETFTTSDSASEDSPEPDATIEGAPQDSAAPDTASDIDPPDSVSATKPQDSSQPVVRLGDRFEWCSDVQAVWTTQEQALAALVAAEAEHEAAVAAYEAATDELDRGEAREIVEATQGGVRRVTVEYQKAVGDAVAQLRWARLATDDSTEGIAYRRAWEALSEESPQIRAAVTDLENAEANAQRANAEVDQARHALRVAGDAHKTLSDISGRDGGPSFLLEVGDRITGRAIGAAEQAGADPADLDALRDSIQMRKEAFWAASDARRAVEREADEQRRSGVTRLPEEIALDAGEANNRAIAAFQAMEHEYFNGVYPEQQNAAGAATAEDALAAASRAVEHLLAIFDGYDAWLEGFLIAETAAEDARVTPLSQDAVDASEVTRALLDAASASFAESTEAAVSDAEAHAAFKRSFEESCQ